MWGRRQALAAGLALVTSALALPAAGQTRESVQPGPSLRRPRAAHTATRLPDGRVLLVGGCTADSCDLTADGATTELFDPVSGQITPGPAMAQPRVSHAAQLLDDGRVLLLGGWTPDGPSASTELMMPGGQPVHPGPAMTTARADATVARSADGRLLVAGGDNGDAPQASAERYDPATATFTPTGATTRKVLAIRCKAIRKTPTRSLGSALELM